MNGGSFVERAVEAAVDEGPGAAYRHRADGDRSVSIGERDADEEATGARFEITGVERHGAPDDPT